MTENELIAQIKELRQIKPRQDWVLFTKKELFKTESRKGTEFLLGFKRNSVPFLSNFFSSAFQISFQHKPAFATIVVLLVLVGVFGFSQKSVPGDSLFSIKKITEQSETLFVSLGEKAKLNLETTNKRLDDLVKIAEGNQIKKLAPAIIEYQQSVSRAAESLAQAEPEVIVEQVKKLEETADKIKLYGIEIGESEELNMALAQVVEKEIKDLEEKTLTEEQENALKEVKTDYEAGKYSQALEKILILSNNE